ncbi:hypothetical protein HPB50_005260 [Hyalomma asiaticum]|uniref:Uncharacterized protein n=1 Tax=Hyalomma asiaticum TaxID=266040 RepID=A0ACB7T3H9_HYAAI|nr:hypothetical protein HPB50_005260 [Hyalomma asiaticum]
MTNLRVPRAPCDCLDRPTCAAGKPSMHEPETPLGPVPCCLTYRLGLHGEVPVQSREKPQSSYRASVDDTSQGKDEEFFGYGRATAVWIGYEVVDKPHGVTTRGGHILLGCGVSRLDPHLARMSRCPNDARFLEVLAIIRTGQDVKYTTLASTGRASGGARFGLGTHRGASRSARRRHRSQAFGSRWAEVRRRLFHVGFYIRNPNRSPPLAEAWPQSTGNLSGPLEEELLSIRYTASPIRPKLHIAGESPKAWRVNKMQEKY